MGNTKTQNNAGFWIRLLATWIDLILIYLVLKGFFYFLLWLNINLYFPFEFTFFLTMLIYGALLTGFRGATFGKSSLGLHVLRINGAKLPFIQSLLRESILKPFSLLILTLGFVWIGISRKKRGLHDYLTGSKVVKKNPGSGFQLWKAVAIISLIAVTGSYIWQISGLIYKANKMDVPKKQINLPFMNRPVSEVTEVSQIKSDSLYASWLQQNAHAADSFAIETASNHQLTLFGEQHEIKENLDFFNKIIPDLYTKAGVRCIGMECIPATMNHKIARLINANEFDEELHMEIARSQPWKMWGFQEYWNVLRTVWKLNQKLPAGSPKMRVVGIDTDWEGPRLAMALPNSEDGIKNVPFAERFKIFSSGTDLVKLIYREELLAWNVENEMIKKGEKGVVLIGSAHAPLEYGLPVVQNNKVLFVKPRFGLILNQRHQGKVGQVFFWQPMCGDKENKDGITPFIEKLMPKNDTIPVGIAIQNSPFANLRSRNGYYFNKYPTVCMGDIMEGLIFFKPHNKFTSCTWTKDYISTKMFLKYKAFYELKKGRKISNNDEFNQLFEKPSE